MSTFKRHFAWNLTLRTSLNLIGLSSFSCQYMRKTLESSDKTKEHMSSQVVVPQECAARRYEENNGFLWIKFWPFETRIQARGIQGLQGVLSEKFKGKPRVTSNKRILKSLSDYVDSVANKWLVKRNGPSVFHITGLIFFFSLAIFLYCYSYYYIFINYGYCFNCHQVVRLVLNSAYFFCSLKFTM